MHDFRVGDGAAEDFGRCVIVTSCSSEEVRMMLRISGVNFLTPLPLVNVPSLNISRTSELSFVRVTVDDRGDIEDRFGTALAVEVDEIVVLRGIFRNLLRFESFKICFPASESIIFLPD